MKNLFVTSYFILVAISSSAQPTGYIWPTDASPYLSSTFAETRSAHFHAGLDIKTWGREGYKVFASKTGNIVRMAITSQGYGRVLYMEHEDGTYTVYAHLQRFIPELQAYIDSVRLINHQFEIDLDVRSENWFFEQGEVIGFTGSTGIGPPHLHFEIRDEFQRPINALLTNLEIKDSIPPKVSAVLAIPMSDTTLIEGSKFPRVFYPSENKNGELELGVIHANGPLAIAINEYDAAEDVTNKYASFQFTLSSNKGIHFQSTHHSFDFDEAATMFIDRIPAFGAYRRSYQTLYNEEKLPVPFYQKNIDHGVLRPTTDTTDYHIVVQDIYKNATTINFQLWESHFKSDPTIQTNPEVYNWYWRNNWLTQNNLSSINLESATYGQPWNSETNERLLYFDDKQMLMGRLTPQKAQTFISPDQSLKVHIRSSSVFDSTTIALYTSSKDGNPSFFVMPYSTPIRKKYFVEYYVGDKLTVGENYHVFHYDPFRDKYTHVPSTRIGGTIHTSPDVLGEFILFPDNDAPNIQQVELRTTNYGEYRVEIEVSDELSGINFEQSEIQVNGIRGITEYDFEEDKLIYIHPEFIPETRNRIEVIVTDNAGNSRLEVFYR